MPLANCELIFKTNQTILLCFKTFFISLIFFFGREFGRPNRYTGIKNPLALLDKLSEKVKVESRTEIVELVILLNSNF